VTKPPTPQPQTPEPETPHTVIATSHVTAGHLFEMWTRMPMSMFVSDGDERSDPSRGWDRVVLSRMVSGVHKTGDAANGHRVVVKFADGPDSRTFAAEEMIEVHMIGPGKTTP
jgi:hypothetical protein